jgi:hypothetical protein
MHRNNIYLVVLSITFLLLTVNREYCTCKKGEYCSKQKCKIKC